MSARNLIGTRRPVRDLTDDAVVDLDQADLRLGKNLRYGRTRTMVALDIFNLFNSNTPDVYQQTYGPTYMNPLSITVGRFFKISAQLDF